MNFLKLVSAPPMDPGSSDDEKELKELRAKKKQAKDSILDGLQELQKMHTDSGRKLRKILQTEYGIDDSEDSSAGMTILEPEPGGTGTEG